MLGVVLIIFLTSPGDVINFANFRGGIGQKEGMFWASWVMESWKGVEFGGVVFVICRCLAINSDLSASVIYITSFSSNVGICL